MSQKGAVLEFLKNLLDEAPTDSITSVKIEGFEHIQLVVLPPTKTNPTKTVALKIVGAGFKGLIVKDTKTGHEILKELQNEKIQKIIDALNNINNISSNNKNSSKAVKLNF